MKELKRLLIVTHNLAGGGCERVISLLSAFFCERGIDVSIATEYACESFYALDPRVRVFPLLQKNECGTRDIPKAYAALRRHVLSVRPDLVLALPEKVNVWAALFLLGARSPLVVCERNDPRRHPERTLKRILRRLVYPFAKGFVFQTAEQAAFFPRRVRARGAVLDNPLDTSTLPAPYFGERGKTVVSAGRLEPQKNFPLLVRAFAAFYQNHPDWKLIIYGEGGGRAALEGLCGELLPEGSYLLPGQSATLDFDMQKAGMFVLPSDFEGMPNVLIEAMAMGLPVVATDCPCGGPASLVRNGESGLLVPVGNEAALAAAMALLADEPGLAAKLGREAAGIRARVDAVTVTELWRAYLERVVRAAR